MAKCERKGTEPVSLLGAILPESVRWAEAPLPAAADQAGLLPAAEAGLFPEELAYLSRAAVKRRTEFAGVRVCARKALADLGLPPAPILPGPTREPGWPSGVRGSMTHCEGYCAAAVARAEDVLSVGIDAEPNRPLPDGVLGEVTLPAERVALAALAELNPAVHWETLLFSAKESVYKAWFPLARRWLGFEQAQLVIEPDGRFEARLLLAQDELGELVPGRFPGRWAAADGLLVTAIVLAPSPT